MHYTVVVDLEMCNVSKAQRRNYNYRQEIIQIGATALDENYEVVDGFCCYVKPEFGDIDEYIKSLTGITRADVAKAQNVEAAINNFVNWLPQDVTIVSWSMHDKTQFFRETEAKNIVNEKLNSLMDTWIDCQPMFAEKMNNERQYRLQEALVAADIDSQGNAHDGLSDAYNTALLYKKIVTEPVFTLNRYYAVAEEEETEVLTTNLADLLNGFDFSNLAIA